MNGRLEHLTGQAFTVRHKVNNVLEWSPFQALRPCRPPRVTREYVAPHNCQDTQTVTTVVLADFTAIQTVPMTNRTLVHVYNDGRREAHPLLLKVSPITIGNHHAAQLCIEARLFQTMLSKRFCHAPFYYTVAIFQFTAC